MTNLAPVDDDILIYTEGCIICNSERLTIEWADAHGQGVCVHCGTPYQLYFYGDNGRILDSLPALVMHSCMIEPMRAYWNETHRNMGLGTYLGHNPRIEDRRHFDEWFGQSEWADILETAHD